MSSSEIVIKWFVVNPTADIFIYSSLKAHSLIVSPAKSYYIV